MTQPAGWYPDPHGTPNQQRYWDGANWTEYTQPQPPQALDNLVSGLLSPQAQTTMVNARAISQIVFAIIGFIVGIFSLKWGLSHLQEESILPIVVGGVFVLMSSYLMFKNYRLWKNTR